MSELTGKLIDEASGQVYELGELSEIGRSHRAVVVIPDPRVSRKHAMIRRHADGFWFFDLGSINGTSINGRRVTTSQLLAPGDLIRIGHHQYRFEGSGTGAPTTTEETVSDLTLVDLQSTEAILLVSDIQNFTGLSERLPPDELAPIIGSWYEGTERILASHTANLDKFIGDSVLAYWLDTSKPTRLEALHTVQAMQETCEEVRRQHHAALQRHGLDFRSGAALHLGPATYGAFSPKEFTLLGDAVNVVFRLESLTRTLGENVLVSGDLLEGWPAGRKFCRPLGSHSVKGRTQPIEVFAFEASTQELDAHRGS